MAYVLKKHPCVCQSWVDVTPDKCWHFLNELHIHRIFDNEISVKASGVLHPGLLFLSLPHFFDYSSFVFDGHATYRKFVGHHFSPDGTSLSSLNTAPDIHSFLTELPWLQVSYWRWSWDYCYRVALGAV